MHFATEMGIAGEKAAGIPVLEIFTPLAEAPGRGIGTSHASSRSMPTIRERIEGNKAAANQARL